MGALFISVIQLGVNNAQNVQPVIAIERAVSYRERPAGMYAPLPYALAAVRRYKPKPRNQTSRSSWMQKRIESRNVSFFCGFDRSVLSSKDSASW